MIAPSVLRVGGMLVGYYRLCPRKAWLSMRGIWMEQESDTVALGRLLDQSSYDRSEKHLTIEAEAPDGTGGPEIRLIGKIDRANLREGVLHETKKSRSCEDAHLWQVRFYLWLLALNRNDDPENNRTTISRFRGQLDYPLLRRTETVTLDDEHITELASTVVAIRELATQTTPPPRLAKRSFCKQCAYEELCYG